MVALSRAVFVRRAVDRSTEGESLVELRDYQNDLVDRTRIALRDLRKKGKRKNVLIQLPTGGGKTAIASKIASSAVERGKTVDFLCHRDFLVDQTSKTFARLDLDHSFVAAGRWHNQWTPVRVCMINTLRNRLEKVRAPDVCIWDEAHHISAATWAAIMDHWPDAVHIGLSATPVRLDGKGLDNHFEELIVGPSIEWLIKQGYLSDYIMFTPSTPDMSGIHTRGGDFKKDEVDAEMNRSVIIGNMVEHYRREAMDRLGVYFCASISHSERTAQAFRDAGIPAVHLDGTHSTTERRAAAIAFARREIKVLTNVDLFGEGYDLAAQAEMDVTIEMVGLARPTQSLGLYMQQIGRALRPDGDKVAIILDHAGNLDRHGLPDEERDWSLSGVKKRDGHVNTTKECPSCKARIHDNCKICPHCKAVQDEAIDDGKGGGAADRAVLEEDGELQQVDKDAVKKARKLEEWQCSSIAELIDLAKRRNYNNPEKWAGFMWTSRKQKKQKRDHAAKQQMNFYEQIMRGR
jgi:DNA repair protein RadD